LQRSRRRPAFACSPDLELRQRPPPIPQRVQVLPSVPLPTASAGCQPCSDGADQRSRTDHETKDHGTVARPRNVLSRLRDDGVNAPLRFWLTETRHGGYEPDQVSTIIRLKTTMTRGCKQNSSRFRAWIIHIFHTLWATLT